jgi:hypothetical protein
LFAVDVHEPLPSSVRIARDATDLSSSGIESGGTQNFFSAAWWVWQWDFRFTK